MGTMYESEVECGKYREAAEDVTCNQPLVKRCEGMWIERVVGVSDGECLGQLLYHHVIGSNGGRWLAGGLRYNVT